ncbi:uroporphyrinogen decarboxylase [Leptospira ilyithenensis]|uniref:Uroporphyrinogen decarboxylase n=1 Tax=Leptospira ilyithenensis TaxID=2484901 RepID=A0A4R9LQE0_9LEPT|nr:uroporphyrinogen decarboxylase [Leptospira ilyithenensis]
MNLKSVTQIRNPRFANALAGIPQDIPPIWFMRQAGRYHSHYRNLKEKYSFLELCKNPELAAEVALGPVREFGFDVSILFSDILFPLEALGMGLDYNPGPMLSFRLDSEKDLLKLRSGPEAIFQLEFQKKAMLLTREVLPKETSLIGFLGGPWTLYTYASSGKHDGNLTHSKVNSGLASGFFEMIIPLLLENLRLQLEGGAELVMIFDTAAGDLSPDYFKEYVAKPLQTIVSRFPGKVGYYAKGTTEHQLNLIRNTEGLAGFGVDHRFSMEELLKGGYSRGFLQGNFDQSLLFLPKEEFKKALLNYLKPIKRLTKEERKGWVSGLGHGVLQGTPESNIKEMIATIREEFHVSA